VAVIDIVPWSRRLHMRRLMPVVVAALLLVIVLAAFLFIPPADVGAATVEAAPAHSSGHTGYPLSGEHPCPEA